MPPVVQGAYGIGGMGSSPYGSTFAFGVISASALNPNLVEVVFNDLLDVADPAILDPTNYTISPGLTVVSVSIETAASVRLVTSRQSFVVYEVTVAEARNFRGSLINPALKTAFFSGFPATPAYFAVGTTPTRIRCIFSSPMLANAALSDPTSYNVTDLQGAPLTIVSATPEQAVDPRSVVLTLSTPMRTTRWYQVVLTGTLLTEGLLTPEPSQSVFQFIQPEADFSVGLGVFTGEVQGGLFGNPAGLVFFSPALFDALPNSILQVDEVDVCTTAYDTYTPPQPIDPSPFYTWSPQGTQTTLGQSGISLWAGFPRLSEARFELTFTGPSMVEPMPHAFDGGCSILMREMWAPSYVALLNNPGWTLFHTTPGTPPTFICANNLAPIPPGNETITVLRMALGGDSSVEADLHRTLGPSASLVGQSSLTAEVLVNGGVNPVSATLNGDASVSATLQEHAALGAALVGGSSLTATLTVV